MDLFLGGIMFESSSVCVSEVNEKGREGKVFKTDEGRDREAVGLIECFPSQEVLERRRHQVWSTSEASSRLVPVVNTLSRSAHNTKDAPRTFHSFYLNSVHRLFVGVHRTKKAAAMATGNNYLRGQEIAFFVISSFCLLSSAQV